MPRAPPAWPRRDGAGAASAPTNRSPSGPPSRVGARLRRARVRPPSRPPLCGWTTGRHRAEAPRAARATAPEARGAARAARLHCAGASHPGPRARVRCSERGVAQSSAARSSSPRRHPRSCDPALTTRSPESAAPPSDPGLTGTPLPDPLRSDDQQLAPWPASATHGAPAYPLRDRTGIQAESFARNPYHLRGCVAPSSLAAPFSDAFTELQAACGCDADQLFAVLQRVNLMVGPSRGEFDATLSHEHLGQLDDCRNLNPAQLDAFRDDL